jgi:hypothetical protein
LGRRAGSQRGRLNQAAGQQLLPDDAQLAQYIRLAAASFGQTRGWPSTDGGRPTSDDRV